MPPDSSPTQRERIEDLESSMGEVRSLLLQVGESLTRLEAAEARRTKEVCEHVLRVGDNVSGVIRESRPIQLGVMALLLSFAFFVASMATGTVETPWGSATFGGDKPKAEAMGPLPGDVLDPEHKAMLLGLPDAEPAPASAPEPAPDLVPDVTVEEEGAL